MNNPHETGQRPGYASDDISLHLRAPVPLQVQRHMLQLLDAAHDVLLRASSEKPVSDVTRAQAKRVARAIADYMDIP